MKKLLIPVLIAVLAGVGGGSGFAYVRASKAYVADSTQRADSLTAHPPARDSVSHQAVAHDTTTQPASSDKHTAVDSTAHAASTASTAHASVTPADSLRAVEASRASLRGATKGLPDAATSVEPPKPGASTTSAAAIVREARNEAMSAALPEQRLAKIFAAMSAKDAAKVMEQMPDADVRSIFAMMSDRTAAAILTQFPAARAAAITKGAVRAPEAKP